MHKRSDLAVIDSPLDADSHPLGGGNRNDGQSVGVKTYVIDTSVLLSDPRALLRFAEHEIVLPIVVITELETKRHHPELGYYAAPRCACLMICEFSTDASTLPLRLTTPVAVCGSS